MFTITSCETSTLETLFLTMSLRAGKPDAVISCLYLPAPSVVYFPSEHNDPPDGNQKEDETFMPEAVNQNGHALQYAAPKQKADETFMPEAVNQNGYAL